MSELGLRERKVVESRRRAEHAAIDLCLEHGYDEVTVDMICEAAEISARTFYNYFGSREAALLGESKPMPSEADIEAYLARNEGSEVEEFAALIARTYDEHSVDMPLVRKRWKLLNVTPDLASLNFARVTEVRGQYAQIVERRVKSREPGMPEAERTRRAQFIVAISMGAMQVIGRGWMDGHTDLPLGDYLHEAFTTMRDITQTPRPTGESNS